MTTENKGTVTEIMDWSISYNNGVFSTTGITNCFDWYTQYYPPTHYFYFANYLPTEDKGEQALHIVKMLMDKDLIKKMDKVKDFVNLMDEIIKIL